MNPRNILRHYLVIFPLTLLFGACNPELCLEDNSLEGDTQYRFTFVELDIENSTQTEWDPDYRTSSAPCERLSLEPMTQFTATTVKKDSLHYTNSCTSWQLELNDFDNADSVVDLGPARNTAASPPYLSFASLHADINLDGCNVDWFISIVATDTNDPFGAFDPAKPPPLIIKRNVEIGRHDIDRYDGCGDTFYSCTEYWAATVERVQ